MREVELHDDRRRVVDVVDGDSVEKPKKIIRSRPMRADELKSGLWRRPGEDKDGKPFAASYHRANSPEQYRAMCQALIAKGFTPMSPVPVTDPTVRIAKP